MAIDPTELARIERESMERDGRVTARVQSVEGSMNTHESECALRYSALFDMASQSATETSSLKKDLKDWQGKRDNERKIFERRLFYVILAALGLLGADVANLPTILQSLTGAAL